MKILYSCVSDLSRPDGETTHVSEIVNSFAKLGHEVHLIAVEEGDLDLHPNVRFYKIFPFVLILLIILYSILKCLFQHRRLFQVLK